ncbi:Uncharacterised protein [Mycobacteroides abscessus subsp. abscessus]|nr:Uncharacterised protein [Mycobacteroides abscessus subsp. abscessus]SKV85821.1 Uncharacterised protein [Mycobacteroides abscessus subsp. abscessus]SKW23662.1 Uncharacterised protein [Mycobacteroides abscessus subsp. abscessus]
MVALAPVVVLLGIYSWQMLRKRLQRDAYWKSEQRGLAASGGGAGHGIGVGSDASTLGLLGGYGADYGSSGGGYCDSGG